MGEKSQNISDYDIQALVDGELDDETARIVHSVIISDPVKLKRYEALLDQKELLQEWWSTCNKEN